MNKEFNGFDEMVEALEENEDMVECKECFDLVPKVDCERAEVGYICPTCKGLRTAPTQTRFVDPYDSYTQDFPEVTEYDPDSVVEYEKEPGLGDALDDLIKDEYEAIDGYEVADEKIQHTAIDADQKDEILDTLDHIKEEEEEHIDELKELCPECDPAKEDTKENLTESAGEPKIYYIYADDLYVDDLGFMEAMDINEVIREAEVRYGGKYHPEDLYVEEAEPEILADLVPSDFIIPPKHFKFNEALTEAETPELPEEESEENENEEVSDLDSAYEAALAIANESGVGQVFGYARKETEEFVAVEPFEVDDPEAVEDDLMAVYDDVAYAYVAYPEKDLEESLFEGVQLNEGPIRFLKGKGQKLGNAAKNLVNRDSGKLMDKFFNKGYIIIVEGPKPSKEDLDYFNKLHKSVWNTVEEALNKAYHGSQNFPTHKVWVFAKPIDTSELTPRERNLAKANNGLGPLVARFKNGRAEEKRDKELADTIQKIEIDKQDSQKVTGDSGGTNRDPRDFLGSDEEPVDDTSNNTPEDTSEDELNLDDDEDLVTKLLGDKVDPEDYTPESYKRYEAAYAKIVEWIKNSKNPKAITPERVNAYKEQAEGKLQKVKKAPEEEDDGLNLDDDDDVVDPKEKAKQMLGEKKAADGYTPESYKKYEAAYAKILAWIEAHAKPETLTQERIDNLKNQAEAKLKEVEDADPDLGDEEEEDTAALDEAKAKAKETLGEKKAADGYTKDSYAKYSENYDKVVAAIEGATSEEGLKKIVDQIPELNKMLEVDDTSEDDTFTVEIEDDGSGDGSPEDEDTTPEDTETTPETVGKLSEVSEEQLKKLFTAVTGQGVGDNKKWKKTMKRMRAKLQELGESLDPNDYQPEDFIIEDLQSEADAVKSLKATAKSLESAAEGMRNMTASMEV